MSEDPSDSATHDRAWGASLATDFGTCFLLFAVGLIFGRRDPGATVGIMILAAALTLWFGCATVGGIGIAAKQPWADRLLDRMFDLALLAVQAMLVHSLIVDALDRQDTSPAVYYGVAVWIGMGLTMYFGNSKNGATRPTYFVCALLPFFLLLIEPVVSAMLFAVPLALILAGQWIGARLQHPHIGAAAGFGVFVLAALAIHWGSRATRKARRAMSND